MATGHSSWTTGRADRREDWRRSPPMLDTTVRAMPEAAHPLKEAAQFIRHYLEMVLAMAIGMMVLGGPLHAVVAWAGYSEALGRGSDLSVLIMAFSMTVPMVAWMLIRGHIWRQAAEMTAAMLIPFAVLIGLDRGLSGPAHLAM